MLAPTIVYDLDGTLADTAEDFMATLNWLLGREGLAPLKVESAGSLLGAGARALIKRGFAASGRSLDPQEIEALFADYLTYYSAHIADRTRLYPGVDKALASLRARGLAAGGLHQQDREPGQAPDRKARDRRPVRLHLRPGHVRRRQAGREAAPRDHRRCGRRQGIARSWSGIRRPTSRRPAPPACPSIAVDFGYADVPVTELGPDRVISHFDQLTQACDALLAVAGDPFE